MYDINIALFELAFNKTSELNYIRNSRYFFIVLAVIV